MGADNATEFADQLSFYTVAEDFKRIPNPYVAGPPVRSAEMFHGRADVFQYVAENLSGTFQDRTLVIYGQRRTGKTSILYQLLSGRLGEKFIPVLVDMQALALQIESTADLLGELAYQIGRAVRKAGINLEDPASDQFSAAPTRSFGRYLDSLEGLLEGRRVVIMFDEFEELEAKIVSGKIEPAILGYFRSLMQHSQVLILLFTGTHRMEELSHDYWSVFFNIALYRRISYLKPGEAEHLIRDPVSSLLDYDPLAVEKIIGLTNGHPYFIQLLCWALVNHCNQKMRNYATLNDVNEVLNDILTTGETHFAYIWQQAAPQERLIMAALASNLQTEKNWIRPPELLEHLVANGLTEAMSQENLIAILDELTRKEILESAKDGALRYRFQVEILRLWVAMNKSIAAQLERGI